MNIRIDSISFSQKRPTGNLIGIVLYLYRSIWRELTNLNNIDSSNFTFLGFLQFLSVICIVSGYKSFTMFLRFIPKYFISFDTTVNVFDFCFQMFANMQNMLKFCRLILYPITKSKTYLLLLVAFLYISLDFST